jgi:hypothetical protein
MGFSGGQAVGSSPNASLVQTAFCRYNAIRVRAINANRLSGLAVVMMLPAMLIACARRRSGKACRCGDAVGG